MTAMYNLKWKKILLLFFLFVSILVALWPGYVAYSRFEIIPAILVGGVAFFILILALVKSEPLRSKLLWIGLALGWVTSVNIEGSMLVDWLVTWVVSLIAALLARLALERLSWVLQREK